MTSWLPPEACPKTRPHKTRGGFTLIEVLVVMGIILLLVSILLPAINRAYQQSVRTSMAADLQVISQALEAYRGDFGDYPRAGQAPSSFGARILCWALVAPGPAVAVPGQTGDGADGPGFRIRGTQGKVYGPYLSVDRFHLSGTIDNDAVISDRYDHPILYFPANRSVAPTVDFVDDVAIGTLPPKATFNYGDNAAKFLLPASQGFSELTQWVFAYRLGHRLVTPGAVGSMPLSTAETPATSAPYLLWSAGPDGQFGPQVAGNLTTGEDDDVIFPDQLPLVPVGLQP